jgi:hypothetical protein
VKSKVNAFTRAIRNGALIGSGNQVQKAGGPKSVQKDQAKYADNEEEESENDSGCIDLARQHRANEHSLGTRVSENGTGDGNSGALISK